MKAFPFILAALAFALLPLSAEEPKKDAPKVDEATKAEFEAARNKFDEARVEFEKVNEKMKAARGESGDAAKRPDLGTLTGLGEFIKQQLLLKDEQYAKVKAMAEAGQKELESGMAELKSALESLEAERAKEAPDLAMVKTLMEKRAKAATAGEYLRYKFIIDLRPLLSPDQVKKWLELRKKMEDRAKSGPRPGGPGGEGKPPKREGKSSE